MSVASAGTLSGTGIITGEVSVDGGHLHPGSDGPGILRTLGGVSFTSDSTFDVELGGTDPSRSFYTQLQVLNGTSLGSSNLHIALDAPPVLSAEYDILRNLDNQAIDGLFAGLSEGAVFDVSSDFGTFAFKITYNGGDDIYHDGSHNDVVLTNLGVVPEPRSLVTFAIGGLGVLAACLWRSKRRDVCPA